MFYAIVFGVAFLGLVIHRMDVENREAELKIEKQKRDIEKIKY